MIGSPGSTRPGGVLDFADGGDAERARHDRDMRGRAAFLQDQPAQPPAVVIEQRRRTHHARDQDGVVRQLIACGACSHAHELAHQPVGEIVEIVQPLAQIRIGGAQHARAGVGLHALDAGFGGEAGADRLAHALQPAAVMREHAVGFEHVLVLAAVGDLAALQHHVDVRAHRVDRVVEPLQFARDVVGDEILDRPRAARAAPHGRARCLRRARCR